MKDKVEVHIPTGKGNDRCQDWPKVAIIILNWNGWWDTIECLESVFRITYPNYQVIVVDNGSSNDSVEKIKAWAEGKQEVLTPESTHPLYYLSHPPVIKPIPCIRYSVKEAEIGGNPELEKEIFNLSQTTNYKPLILIQTGTNLGFAGGSNVGIKYVLAKHDFDSIILLNNDVVIAHDAVSILVNARLKYGDESIFGGRIYYYSDPEKIWYDGGHFYEWLGRTVHINMGKRDIRDVADREVNFITFCYVLIPTKILKEIGLLDERYFMYVEDLDYCYRIWKRGFKLYHIPSSKIWHKVGASVGEEASSFSAYWIMRNRIRFIKNKLPFLKRLTALLFIALTRIYRFPTFLIRNKGNLIKSQIRGIVDEMF
jgi:hypothetical protein